MKDSDDAGVVELADAPVSGTGGRKLMGVQIPPSAPYITKKFPCEKFLLVKLLNRTNFSFLPSHILTKGLSLSFSFLSFPP